MEKIIVVGPSGSGKSYLSKRLSELLNIPLYHLDQIWWKEDKTHITRDEFDETLKFILSKDKWIIDGDYSRTYEMRMEACDTIVFLNFPLEECLLGVESRIGTHREDIPWVEDEFDPEFKEWIINWFSNALPKLQMLLDKYKTSKNIIALKTRKEEECFLENI